MVKWWIHPFYKVEVGVLLLYCCVWTSVSLLEAHYRINKAWHLLRLDIKSNRTTWESWLQQLCWVRDNFFKGTFSLWTMFKVHKAKRLKCFNYTGDYFCTISYLLWSIHPPIPHSLSGSVKQWQQTKKSSLNVLLHNLKLLLGDPKVFQGQICNLSSVLCLSKVCVKKTSDMKHSESILFRSPNRSNFLLPNVWATHPLPENEPFKTRACSNTVTTSPADEDAENHGPALWGDWAHVFFCMNAFLR